MCIFFGFGKKYRLTAYYSTLHSGMGSIVLESGENKLAANCPTTPNHSDVQRRRTYEQGWNSEISSGKRSTIAHSPFPKLPTYCGCSTGTPWWSTRTRKAGIQTKHFLSSGISNEWSHLKAQKNRIPRAISRIVQFKNTQTWILLSKGFILQKNEVTTNAKNPFNEACFQFARKAAFSSLFPAYCWKHDCQNSDTSS